MDTYDTPTSMPAPPASTAPPAQAPPTPTQTKTNSPWKLLLLGLGVVALTVAAFALVLYRQEASARDDAERALAESRSALADAENRADDAEAQATEVGAELAGAEAALAQSEARAAEAEAARDEGEAGVADYEAAMSELLATATIGGLGLSGSDTDCIAEAMVGEFGPDAADIAYSGLTIDSNDAVRTAAETCGVDPATFENLLPQLGDSYGDNEVLDALYDVCATGDGAACDSLFLQSQVGTEYETFGFTCGGRFAEADAPGFCDGAF